jgi:hypothetical protein
MAFFSHTLSSIDASLAPPARRLSPFQAILKAMMQSRQRQADREIARYIALNGGKLTDEIERRIERRFLTEWGGR